MTKATDDKTLLSEEQDEWGFYDLDEETPRSTLLFRPPSRDDILYLIKKYPFLKLVNGEVDISKVPELPPLDVVPKLVRAESGWLMHDYGFYITSSLGELLYGTYGPVKEGEEEEGGVSDLNPGRGTVIKQAFDTAGEMVALGRSHNWESLQILEGTELMKWAAWVIADELKLAVKGYEPKQEDEERKARLKRSENLANIGIRLTLY